MDMLVPQALDSHIPSFGCTKLLELQRVSHMSIPAVVPILAVACLGKLATHNFAAYSSKCLRGKGCCFGSTSSATAAAATAAATVIAAAVAAAARRRILSTLCCAMKFVVFLFPHCDKAPYSSTKDC